MNPGPISPRSQIFQVPLAAHGGLRTAELERQGTGAGQVIDFSASINPFGPSPAVHVALASAAIASYPDPDVLALRRALSALLQRPLSQIIVGNGSAELLWLIALAFVRPHDRVLVLGPTFGEYARAAALMGAEVRTWRARPEQDFALHPAEIARLLARIAPRLLFLCHPNNPTGTPFPLPVLKTWTAAHPGTLFVVDEAYLSFTTGADSALSLQAPNLLVIRSLTKDQALAGLRLGYAFGAGSIITALRQVQPPWSVNTLAQVAGVAALRDSNHLRQSLAALTQAKQDFVRALQAMGWQPVPSSTHFFLLPVSNATEFRAALFPRGLIVRDCSSFGLPRHVRIATRRPEENAILLDALAEQSILSYQRNHDASFHKE